jgi:hypothetical protein
VKRTLFTFASLLSLLMCLATVVLWVRSHYVRDDVFWVNSEMGLGVSCGLGHLYFWQASTLPPTPPHSFPWEFHHEVKRPARSVLSLLPTMRHVSVGGVALQWGRGPESDWGYYHHELFAPAWLVFVTSVFLPSRWAWIRWQFRNRECRCPTCSYNLTGNTSGVCPECGTPVKATA